MPPVCGSSWPKQRELHTWSYYLKIPQLKGVVPITLHHHGSYASSSRWEFQITTWEGLNCRQCITNYLPAPSCDRTTMVKCFPVAVTVVCDYILMVSGRHVQSVFYSVWVWNRIQRVYHRQAVARYWHILTSIHLYCTVSTSFVFWTGLSISSYPIHNDTEQ